MQWEETKVGEVGEAGFTEEEVHQQALSNGAGWPLVFLAYARDRGQSAGAAARDFGRLAAPSWDEVRGAGALVTARLAALNAVTTGAKLLRLTGDEARAEAVLSGWPDPEALEFFRLTQAEADAFHGHMGPIAEYLGLRFAYRRDGDEVVLTVESA